MILGLRIKNVLFIILGAAIFSFGLVHFNMQNNLAEGGFTGITLLLFFIFNIDPSISNLVLNIPLFLVGWKLLGRKSFVYTLIGTVSVSLFLFIFQRFHFNIPLDGDLFLAALFAGVFIGIGLGITFRFGGTTGGVDIIARLLHKYKGISMGRTMFMFDAIVITVSLLTYLNHKEAMYTLVAVFVGARVVDFMQEGAYAARGALIISENHHQAIADMIMEQMERGVTVLNGRGSFSKQNKDVLYCVVGRNEIVHLKKLINAIDPHAFVSLIVVHDVMGEGFTFDENKNPYDA
ncbi:YitT family protein [Lederbergia lenta]|uniref:Integral inner membrane protein n=1 Tax=Lederbergia lenta TaxID=1467 RepID=A0A2X4W1K0_LEDLE|nr:YitT family protein [Lederbergia lenta]MCM3109287.1 YitT family protein [Lederbergia lenta]MEC2324948.1 YitT family protein [Lederbergia lenta]SQI56559.1 integral inner membrane protein [Lederbergia lenta]